MIQRIQSLYLLIITVLQTVLFFSRQGTFITELGEEPFRVATSIPIAILIGCTALIPFITIFMYHYRMRQLRLTVLNGILLLMLQAVIIWLLVGANSQSQDYRYSLTAIFPFVSAILSYLTIRAIGKDEAMVRALDRLR